MPYHILPRGAYQGGQFAPILADLWQDSLSSSLLAPSCLVPTPSLEIPEGGHHPRYSVKFVITDVNTLIESGGQALCRQRGYERNKIWVEKVRIIGIGFGPR